MLVIVFIQLAKSLLTLLYIKRKAQTSTILLSRSSTTLYTVCWSLRTMAYTPMVYNLLWISLIEVLVRTGIEHLFMGPSHKHGYKSRYFFRDSKKIIAFYFVLRLIFLNFAVIRLRNSASPRQFKRAWLHSVCTVLALKYSTAETMKQRNATYNALNIRGLKIY